MSSPSYHTDTIYPLPKNVDPPFCGVIFNSQEWDSVPFISVLPSIRNRLLDSSEYHCDHHGLISKPPGQAGCPGRGGYNLRAVLRWDIVLYSAVQKFIKERIRHYMEQRSLLRGLTITKQPPETISMIQDEAKQKFKLLSNYEGNWPSRDIIATYLGNTSHGKTG
ncbi:hypothetical protein GALMADRAFT_145971 [Galerina marginata CBS 339.88]|uniref:Uncharacterized protein n=1 Tax=Galerina marginata (strain CBS 339.88) TaxID=685588 RepID=A0A067SMR1_GALM3|nr:hypothetical protein GALMADRAFT_145971 [Galerina marginata CBS 339.88]